jgi:hypothetical protein
MARPWRSFKIGKLELYLAWWGGWSGSPMLSLERSSAAQGGVAELSLWLGKLELVASWPSSPGGLASASRAVMIRSR